MALNKPFPGSDVTDLSDTMLAAMPQQNVSHLVRLGACSQLTSYERGATKLCELIVFTAILRGLEQPLDPYVQ